MPMQSGLTRACALCGVVLVVTGCGPLTTESDAAVWEPGIAPGGCPAPSLSGPVRLPSRVLLMVGDGMGPGQVDAARLLKGGSLRMDDLPAHTRVATDSWSTLNVEGAPVTDSAAAATAFATGVLTRNVHVAVSPEGEPLTSVLDLAQERGYATGLVTTSYLYDATPMAFAVHVDNRALYEDVVVQLLERSPLDLLLGGGGGLLGDAYLPWRMDAEAAGYTLVFDADMLLERRGDGSTLGLFVGQVAEPPTELAWWTTPAHRRGLGETDPSLPQMTTWSIETLSSRSDEWFLLVEDEHIDELGHLSGAYPELATEHIAAEVAYFDDAVGAAIDWLEADGSLADTLIVVLADHETGGYVPSSEDPRAGVFWTSGHTRTPVDVFASGPGADELARLCHLADVFALMTGRMEEL